MLEDSHGQAHNLFKKILVFFLPLCQTGENLLCKIISLYFLLFFFFFFPTLRAAWYGELSVNKNNPNLKVQIYINTCCQQTEVRNVGVSHSSGVREECKTAPFCSPPAFPALEPRLPWKHVLSQTGESCWAALQPAWATLLSLHQQKSTFTPPSSM